MTGETRGFEPTREQADAIRLRGGALLVAASAGSGKTRVLVERLLDYVAAPDVDDDIDDFLVITYTRAAAGELRGRILGELARRRAEDPGNVRLGRQAVLCHRASISTIHGFCAGLLRENAHKLGLPPDFRVADENECALLKAQALDEIFDSRCDAMYGEGVSEPGGGASEGRAAGFALLADMFFTGRGDRRLRDIVTDIHTRLRSHPYPDEWVSDRLKELDPEGVGDAAETVWGAVIMSDARRAAAHWLVVMRRLEDEMDTYPDFKRAYGRSVAVTVGGIESFLASLEQGWDAARARARVEFPQARVSGYNELKEMRARCAKGMKRVAELFEYSSAELLEDMGATAPVVTELMRLTLDFDAVYAERKRERGLIDFSDQEHMACKLLTDRRTGAPTDAALAARDRFREILVDEYQDVNAVQELIFRAVSREGENIFMVGDARQSIYGFRLADPTIFLKKYRQYADDAPAPGGGRRVVLAENFRSRAGILDAVNYVFENIMSEELGGMDYTEREFLRAGRAGGEDAAEPPVELDVLDMGAAQAAEDAPPEGMKTVEAEAEHVARRIGELMRAEPFIPDGNGGLRAADCEDFVILLRSLRNKAVYYFRALERHGIPAEMPGGEDFFETTEIKLAMSLLYVIDNPMQDVPLISVLRSPVYGFTADELARIRAAAPDGDFYTALRTAAATDGKCGAFIAELDALREAAPDMSAERLIFHVYNVTKLPGRMAARRGGARRRENLMLLAEYARKLEAGGYKGLFGFVSFMRRLAESGREPGERRESAAGGGTVRIMSVHKSKGLEFPVVFLADTAKRFNRESARAPALVHSKLGIGVKRRDTRRRIEYRTLARAAIGSALTSEMMSEEMRVLYVAMTRAREKLVIVSTQRQAAGNLERLSRYTSRPVPDQTLRDSSSISDWILLAALTRPESLCLTGDGTESVSSPGAWDMRLYDAPRPDAYSDAGGAVRADAETAPHGECARAEDVEELRRRFAFEYAWRTSVDLPSKLTVSEVKGRLSDAAVTQDAQSYVRERRAEFVLPAIRGGSMTGTERGTAVHLIMRHIDYGKCASPEGIKGEIARLADTGAVTREQAAAADVSGIFAFFDSATGAELCKADRVFREFKFSLLTPASEFFPGGDGDILFQGIVDCAYVSDERITVIDFKTDRVTADTAGERAEYYSSQLRHYASALTRITGLPVARRYIYFFATGQFWEVGE
ncbi:MAG: helicase-exonuclease AddAB subunit AddA [Oscillospiraceae bacterium]|jgi:ATP-dependent helicase/nuclease subunit A|nr:helicase-exonuclease AddAB subunit AddA [Oscillospiraceae bacterium]